MIQKKTTEMNFLFRKSNSALVSSMSNFLIDVLKIKINLKQVYELIFPRIDVILYLVKNKENKNLDKK